MPVLNFRVCQKRVLVSSVERSVSILRVSRYCLPINQARGVIKSKDRRGKREVREFRDWERSRMRTREKERVTEGGF